MKRRRLQPQRKTISSELKRFLRICETKNQSERTIEQYKNSVERFEGMVGDIYINQIDDDDIINFINELKCSLAPGSVNFYLRGLRVFLNHCSANVNVQLIKEKKKQIIPFTEEQIKKLLQQPDRETFVGLRDYTMLQLLFDTGMRIAEACGIRRKDILKDHIIVTGKGDKERAVPLGSYCRNILDNYLLQVSDLLDDQPIFITINNLPMDRHRANSRIKIYAKKANIEGVRASCHTFRHTFARMYLINGGDMYSLQIILGHETLDMVKEYVNMFTNDIIEMHKKYSPSNMLYQKRSRKLV